MFKYIYYFIRFFVRAFQAVLVSWYTSREAATRKRQRIEFHTDICLLHRIRTTDHD